MVRVKVENRENEISLFVRLPSIRVTPATVDNQDQSPPLRSQCSESQVPCEELHKAGQWDNVLAKHSVTLGNFTPFTANFWRMNRKKRLALSSLNWLLPSEKIFTLYSPERRESWPVGNALYEYLSFIVSIHFKS